MEKKALYRSAIRSKENIRNAFLELLMQKEYEKITVTDIIKIADINRSTFYAHYPDVRGVIEEIENEIIEQLLDVLSQFEFPNFFTNPTPLLLQISRSLEDQEYFYKILIQSNGASIFLDKLKDVVVSYLLSDTSIPDEVKHSTSFTLRTCYFSGGIINIYQQWFEGNLDCSLNDVAIEVSKIIQSGF